MADIYLSSVDGSDSDDGSTWALAKATLAAALTAAGAGGTVYVDHSHAESLTGNMTLTSPGTTASPTLVCCVDRTGNPEPPTAVATTGTVTATGSISFSGVCFVYGLTFKSGNGAASSAPLNFTSTSPWWWRFTDSKLHLASSTGATNRMFVGTASGSQNNSLLELVDTVFASDSSVGSIVVQTAFRWRGGSVSAAPTTLLVGGSAGPAGIASISGVDLSVLSTSKNLVDISAATFNVFKLENNKLGASVSVTTGSPAGRGGTVVELVNCDSADTNYRYRKACYQGDIYHETTIVLAASDGTTTFSRKMVSSANSKLYSPLVFEGPLVWNETVGSSVTATIEVVTDNVTLTDKEAWLEIEYMGTSGFPLALFADDRAADNAAFLGSGTNQTTSSASWTTTGLTTPVKQKFAVTFTPQEKGWIRGRVMLAKASTTMYVDPLMTLS